jgi:hypothetical protein
MALTLSRSIGGTETGGMESVMTKKLLLALPFVLLPNVAFAEPGSGTDLYRVHREVEAMQRDGRWERLLAEGQANRWVAWLFTSTIRYQPAGGA